MTARTAAMRSPYAAGRVKLAGRDGDTTPGTRKESPTKRCGVHDEERRQGARGRHNLQLRPDIEGGQEAEGGEDLIQDSTPIVRACSSCAVPAAGSL